MAIPKVFGTETEYGIAAVGAPDFNPVLSSSLLISTYAGSLRRIRWDYEQESPLRDARGFEPVPAREGSDEDLGLANVILPNGARYYVDHAHPEYSTPECTTPRDLVVHDKAGERILERSMREVAAAMPNAPQLSIYKNNSDGKGNSYGTHENYLVDRATPFGDIVRDLTPFFVTRIVFTGAGKVGAEAPWDDRGRGIYQLTQRADFFETEVGLETTLKRPIINTRDEPHADPERYRRLHVIVGDANLCEVSTLLKIGTTAIVLKMIEDAVPPGPVDRQSRAGAARDLARHHLHPRGRPRRRQAGQRGPAAVGVPGAREEVRGARGRHSREPRRGGAMGGRAHRARDRAALAASRARLGRQAPCAAGIPRSRRSRVERPEAARDRPAVPRRPSRQGPLLSPRGRRQGGARHRRTTRSTGPSWPRRRTRAPTSADDASTSIPRPSPRHRGTR